MQTRESASLLIVGFAANKKLRRLPIPALLVLQGVGRIHLSCLSTSDGNLTQGKPHGIIDGALLGQAKCSLEIG